MWPIAMDADPVLVERVVRISGYMRARVDYEDPSLALRGEPFGDRGAGETGADDEIIVRHRVMRLRATLRANIGG